MKDRPRLRLVLASVAILLGVVTTDLACHKKVTGATPKAEAALRADAVTLRVNELQAAVIEACGPSPQCAPNSINVDLARQIVKTCIDIRTVLKSVPDGWAASVKSAWAQGRQRLDMVQDPVIRAAIAAVDAVVAQL